MALSRRNLLQRGGLVAAAGALPSWMPRLAFRQPGVPARGDILVCVFQRGGMDGLSAVIPYQERQYFDLRPTIRFKAPDPNDPRASIRLDDAFALNPGLAALRQAWDDGQLAVVHAVGSPDPTRSHFDAMDYMERGTPGEKSLGSGWLGRHLATTASQNDSPFRAIGMGSMLQQSLRGPIPAAVLQSIADFHLQGRAEDLAEFRRQLQALYSSGDWFDEDAQATFAALDLLEQSNPANYQPANGAVYPDNAFSQGLKQIAQLIKADVGLEVACVDIGGWDLHVNQVWSGYNDPTRGMMFNLLKQLADGLAAFYRDLGSRFRDPGITVVTMSEFGRRVAQNAGHGTDHGRGNCMFLLGNGVVSGVHAQWPGLEPGDLVDGDLAVTIDYRDILAELLARRLNNAAVSQVFPGHAVRMHDVFRTRAGTVAPTPVPPAMPTAVPTDQRATVFLPWVGR